MLRIPCPFCGERDQVEFRFGSEGGVERPNDPASSAGQQWAEYLFYRENTKGMHQELWFHAYGCRQWFVLERNTVTHEITAARALRPESP